VATLYCLLLALLPAAVPFALALVVQHVWGNWPRRPKLWLSALPLPLLLALPSAWLLADVARRPASACMKSVCEIDRYFGLCGLFYGAIALVIGLATANVALNKAQPHP
jgi:hypothetical protein